MNTSVPEKHLEDFIFNSDMDTLGNAGLNLQPCMYKYRQLNLDKFGIIDILTIDYNSYSDFVPIKDCNPRNELYRRDVHINVIELKANNIDTSTYLQSIKYIFGLKSILEKKFNLKNTQILFEITLIGNKCKIDLSSMFVIPNLITYLGIYTYEYADSVGFKFNEIINPCDYLFKSSGIESIPNNQRIDGILKSDLKEMIEFSKNKRANQLLNFKIKNEMEELNRYLIE